MIFPLKFFEYRHVSSSDRVGKPYRGVKPVFSIGDEKEQKQLLMDLDVVMRSSDCPYIVQFYGALFREVGINYSGFS